MAELITLPKMSDTMTEGVIVRWNVKVGDTVLYGKYAGTEIQIEGQDLLIMRESDILAIV
jgi:co-chaperonin GroES (HSP10)